MAEITNSLKQIRIILILIRENELAENKKMTTTSNPCKLSSVSRQRTKTLRFSSGSTKDLTDHTSDEKFLEISFLNSVINDEKCLKIIDLKQKISEETEIKLDLLNLYTFEEAPKRISDNEVINDHLKSDDMNSAMYQNTTNIFYYSISKISKINVNIEYYQHNISTINLELNLDSSIYFLKYILKRNSDINIPINEQTLKLLSISQNILEGNLNESRSRMVSNPNDISLTSHHSLIGKDNRDSSLIPNKIHNNPINNYISTPLERDIRDDETLLCIIKSFNSLNSEKFSQKLTQSQNFENYSINFLLIQKTPKKFSIGLDLSFTILRDLFKIEFTEVAPLHRQASDGLNIFFYCKNPKCEIYEKLFLINLKYGKFNLIHEINSSKCVKCMCKNISAKNLGFVNCDWKYSGIMTNKKSSFINGDGMTINKKLYIMKEVDILACFTRLEIRVKEIEVNFMTVSSMGSDIELEDIVMSNANSKNLEDMRKSKFNKIKETRAIDKLPGSLNLNLFENEKVEKHHLNTLNPDLNSDYFSICYKKFEGQNKDQIEKSMQKNIKIENSKNSHFLDAGSNNKTNNTIFATKNEKENFDKYPKNNPGDDYDKSEIGVEKDKNYMNFINKSDYGGTEIKYESKNNSVCCVNELSKIKNIKKECIIF